MTNIKFTLHPSQETRQRLPLKLIYLPSPAE